MATPSQIMKGLMDLRRKERDRRIRKMGRRIDRWSLALERRLLGIIMANQGGTQGVMGSVDVVLIGSINDQAEAVDKALREYWQWAYQSAVRAIVLSVPLGVWVARQMPILSQPGEIGELNLLPESFTEQELPPGSLAAEDAYQRIIDGKVTRERAMGIIADTEFPPPSIEQVRHVLDATSATDGLSAIERIKTVEPAFRSELRQTIVAAITQPDRASAIEGLARKLRHLVGNDPGKSTGMNYRAKRIARTEGVRIAEDALRDSWERVPEMVTGIEYKSAHAPRTRQSHIANEGKYHKQPNGDYLRADGRVFPTIPAGPNCLPVGQEVSGVFTAGLKAFYSGKVVEVQTKSGRSFSVTPNHPVLTVDGFVPARTLCQGSKLLRNDNGMECLLAKDAASDHKDAAPPLIEDVFKSLCRGAPLVTTAETIELDFHGDEMFVHGDVDIVAADRMLLHYGYILGSQSSSDLGFSRPNMQAAFATGDSTPNLPLQRVGISAATLPHGRAGSLGQVGTATLVKDSPLAILCVGLTAKLHVSFTKVFRETIPTDADLFRELLKGFPLIVSVDEVIEVRHVDYTGHVYDLQTEVGWYTCDSIIIHNCLCWSSPIFRFDVDRTIPPANMQRFKQAQARSKAEIAAIKARKGKRKPKPKPDLPLKAKPTPRKKAAPVVPKRKPVVVPKKPVVPKVELPVTPKPKPLVPKPTPVRKPVAVKPKPKVEPLPAARAEATFRKAEAEIIGGKRETAVAFDANGNELFRKTGTSDAVIFRGDEVTKLRGGTLTHNHPIVQSRESNKTIRNLPLSAADGRMLSDHNMKEIRAVTTDYRFSLKPKKGVTVADPKTISRKWNAREKKIYRKETTRLSKEVADGKITHQEARDRGFLFQEQSQHQAWEETADSLGLEYRRIRRG